jgi:hypothetical protein
MNVTASAPDCSAAISNEPSPLCSSSVITTICPAAMASINCGTASNARFAAPFN